MEIPIKSRISQFKITCVGVMLGKDGNFIFLLLLPYPHIWTERKQIRDKLFSTEKTLAYLLFHTVLSYYLVKIRLFVYFACVCNVFLVLFSQIFYLSCIWSRIVSVI